MNLVEERNLLKLRFSLGNRPSFMEHYEENRDSELWRSSLTIEELCEYILFLEEQQS